MISQTILKPSIPSIYSKLFHVRYFKKLRHQSLATSFVVFVPQSVIFVIFVKFAKSNFFHFFPFFWIVFMIVSLGS